MEIKPCDAIATEQASIILSHCQLVQRSRSGSVRSQTLARFAEGSSPVISINVNAGPLTGQRYRSAPAVMIDPLLVELGPLTFAAQLALVVLLGQVVVTELLAGWRRHPALVLIQAPAEQNIQDQNHNSNAPRCLIVAHPRLQASSTPSLDVMLLRQASGWSDIQTIMQVIPSAKRSRAGVINCASRCTDWSTCSGITCGGSKSVTIAPEESPLSWQSISFITKRVVTVDLRFSLQRSFELSRPGVREAMPKNHAYLLISQNTDTVAAALKAWMTIVRNMELTARIYRLGLLAHNGSDWKPILKRTFRN